MNEECLRIADQLRRAFAGAAWHGPPLTELLAGINARQACARPLAAGHNVWELVLHMNAYLEASLEAVEGGVMPKIYRTERDWSEIRNGSDAEWTELTTQFLQNGERLAHAAESFEDSRLQHTVPGREYDFYRLFHGVVQHCLFHGGQIALLKRA